MDPITTARDTSRTVAHMFNLMDAWRHLPGYRLEGRLAPFFEYFLHDVLSEYLSGVELHPVLIPEFPLRKGTLDGNNGSNQSYNVDYVAFSMDRRTAFLIELKTDMSSIDKEQEKYLRCAREKGFGPFVCGIKEICEATDYKSKYTHLLHLLAQLELVKITDVGKLYRHSFPAPRRGWTETLRKGVKPDVEGKLEHTRVIYIQPRESNGESSETKADPDYAPDPFEYIYFTHVAEIVQRFGDLGSVFAHYLRRWSEDPGRHYPRTVAHQS